jgi:PDZ domain-containing secreted protein
MKTLQQLLLSVTLVALAAAQVQAGDKEAIARGWVEAAHKGRDAFMAYVKEHMAEDGVWEANRYVGFGFQMDPMNDEQLVVTMVSPDTPAAGVLKEGDVFVSVADVPATAENRDRMAFRGKPGEPIKAVISRDGKEMPIEVSRGVIAKEDDKATVLRGISLSDPEAWPVDEGKVVDVVGEGNVVFVVDEVTETEDDTGITYTDRSVTRLEFNDRDQVVRGWSLDEGRFVLEQLGYTISR